MTGIDHRLPPIQTQRPKAFDKKSRSTTSWPILACKLGDLAIPALLSLGALLVKHLGKLFDRLAFPGSDLCRMDFVLGRQFGHRQMTLDRL